MTVRLGPRGDVLSKFQNVEALENELERENKNVTRLASLLEAVTQRDETKKKVEKLREQKQTQADKLPAKLTGIRAGSVGEVERAGDEGAEV